MGDSLLLAIGVALLIGGGFRTVIAFGHCERTILSTSVPSASCICLVVLLLWASC